MHVKNEAPSFPLRLPVTGQFGLGRLVQDAWVSARRQKLKLLPEKLVHSRRLTLQPMKARNRLLLFIALDGAPRGLDPVRLQKGMFLFAQESDADAEEKYSFIPYNYGPMSAQIYTDLDDLVSEGLVETVPVNGQSWSRYVATDRGRERGRALMSGEVPAPAARRLHAIKRDVASKTFREVLEDVYDRYPDFATKSVFRRQT
jgi:DNA-binding PadR family transcriptional regulator